MMRAFIAFVVLTALLTATLIYMYYIRRSIIQYEGFSEEDISAVEDTVREAVPQLDKASLGHVLKIVKRLAGKVLQPAFFTDAIRRSGMSQMELARDYIESQKAKS
jgi:hypothetical protein